MSPRSTLRRTAPALVLSVALAVTGCGGDGDQDAREPSSSAPSTSEPAAPWEDAAPAQGLAMAGTGYTFKAVKGWTNATKGAKAVNQLVEVAASAAPDASGFATNVNVVVSNAGVQQPDEEQLDEISAAIGKELVKLVPQLKVNEQTEVAGQPALDHEGAAARDGVNYYIHQFVTFKDGKAYTITFSFSRAATPAQRTAVIHPVLASWAWKS